MSKTDDPTILPPAAQNVVAIAMTPFDLLQRAVEQGADIDKLRELMNLQREWEADRAEKAWVKAMSEFRAEAVVILKKKKVSFDNTNYKHATLDHIVEVVSPALSKHGLSHRWETTQTGPSITVTCVVTHELGHSERNPLTGAPDTSGKKNAIQAIGSAVTYLQRYTLLGILGLSTKDADDDGVSTDQTTVSAEQIKQLEDKLEANGVPLTVLLRIMHVDSLDQVYARNFDAAMKQLDNAGKRKPK